jgi:uncharacterized DUF497 family protein
VKIEFDPAKSAKNAEERGLPFELAAELDWSAGQIIETRYAVVAPLHGRLHFVAYCIRGDKRRIMSFRKANEIEEEIYEKANAARAAPGDAAPDEA